MSNTLSKPKRHGLWSSMLDCLRRGRDTNKANRTQLDEALQVEPLEQRLALAVASIPLPIGGFAGIDLFGNNAGLELTNAYENNRSYRDTEQRDALAMEPTGFYISSTLTVDEAAGFATLTITRDSNITRQASVDYTTRNGSSVDGQDFPLTAGTLVFNAGVSSLDIMIPITDDDIAEATESFFVDLSNGIQLTGPGSPTSLRIIDGTSTVTITDNDVVPDFTINDVVVNEAAGTATFTVTRTGAQEGELTVDFATASGTAIAGADFTANSGTLTFDGTSPTQTITVQILDEAIYEKDELFTVQLSNAQNLEGGGVTISDPTGQGTITNDEPLPVLTITNEDVHESGGTVTFTLTLDRESEVAMEVLYATLDAGTAPTAANLDYTSTTGRVIFPSLSTEQTITVNILEDNIVEGEETFEIMLSAPTTFITTDAEVPVLPGNAVGTIIDNDSRLAVGDITVIENVGNPPGLRFTITRTGATLVQTDVVYRSVDDTAINPDDFNEVNGTLQFLPGETSRTIDIVLHDDNIYEFIEMMTFEIVSANNPLGGSVVFTNMTATGTITDDDPPPNISVNDVAVFEHEGVATFTVSIDAAAGVPITVTYNTVNGSAIAGSDYVGIPSNTVTIPAGSTSATFTVTISEDQILENPNETFSVLLSNPTNGAMIVDAVGVATIRDNDNVIDFFNSNVTVAENAGSVTLTVTRSGASDTTTTVTYTTVNGTATSGNDYNALSGTLTFAPGETFKNVTILLRDDLVYEGNENFTLMLTSATNSPGGTAVIATNSATINLTENEAAPTISISDASGFEHAGTIVFDVTLSNASALPVTVNYSTANNTASAALGDYMAVTGGTLNFAAGVTQQQITITILEDGISEANETFFVNLSGAVGATFADSQGIGTILDNDVQISIAGSSADEDAGFMNFTLTRTGTTAVVTTVDFAVDGSGTATSGIDMAPSTGTATFGIGASTTVISVPIIDDMLYEGDETFFIQLSNAMNAPGGTATITVGTALGTIIEDDPPPQFVINDVTVFESDGFATFTVTLQGTPSTPATVNFTTADSSAVAAADYSTVSGTLTFAPGLANQTQTVTVPIINNAVRENDESFNVVLSLPTGIGVLIADNTGVGTIWNEDVEYTINNTSVAEGFGNMQFTITRLGGAHVSSSVNFNTSNGSALGGVDYSNTSGTVNFGVGVNTQIVNVGIINDSLIEFDEDFFGNLSGGTVSNGGSITISDSQGQGIIANALSAGDPTFVLPVSNGNNWGNATFQFAAGTQTVRYESTVVFVDNDGSVLVRYFNYDTGNYVNRGLTIGSGDDIQFEAIVAGLSDTVLLIYNQNGFNPSNPTANLIYIDDDGHPGDARSSIFNGNLLDGPHTIVIAQFSSGTQLGTYGYRVTDI